MKKTAHHLARKLFAQCGGIASKTVREADLARLPGPVREYLRYVQVIGRPMIRTVRLQQAGLFRMRPGQRWQPLIAEQYFTADPPAFLWHGTIRPIPFLSVSALDMFSEGRGSMIIKLLSRIPLAHEQGPEIDQGELARFLAETAWFPTAWLSDYIRWESIDGQSAKATMIGREARASAILSFNADRQLTRLTAQRYYQKRLEGWSGQYHEYHDIHGIRIPTRVEVTWNLDSGDFTYFQGEIIDIEYDVSSPYS